MSVSKNKDGYICFNADCGAKGNLINLVSRVTDRNYFEASRYVLLNRPTEQQNFEEELEALMSEVPEFREFTPGVLERLADEMSTSDNAGREYMRGRGFTDDTIDYFEVGYSKKKNMVAVPVHSPDGTPVGLVGRSISGKDFKNSIGLPTSKIFFNLHRAKRASSTVIVVESSFDALSVHQSGYPNVVAGLGTNLSAYKVGLLDKYFDRIIIFADNRDLDPAGKKMGEIIADRYTGRKDVLWANYKYGETYPGNVKDATDILEKYGESAVAETIKNAIPHFEYASSMV